jgi:hypothetical protein
MSDKQCSLADQLCLAFDDYMGDIASGPWTDLADELAEVIATGELTLERAGRIDHLLRRTRGDEGRSACGTCLCPVPGLSHHEHD